MITYSYAVIPKQDMHEVALIPIDDGAYVTKSKKRERVSHLLRNGYRWVRTDGENAILEKSKTSTK